MTPIQKTREQLHYLANGLFTCQAKGGGLEDYNATVKELENMLEQARTEALTALLEAMPEISDQTVSAGDITYVEGFRRAIQAVTAIIKGQLRGKK